MQIGDVAHLVEHYEELSRGTGFNSSHLQLTFLIFELNKFTNGVGF